MRLRQLRSVEETASRWLNNLATESPLTVVGRRAAPYQSPLAVVAGRIDPIMINQTIAALTILRINPPTVAVFFLTLLEKTIPK